jgi:4-diphosphocytidyl-2-C-methyl-D-erythritol kinase
MSPPASAAREQGGAWPAPAKLNLFLHILGRRDDGYHDLQTAFQFLDFGDELHIEPTEDGRIRRPAGLEGLAEKDDLVVSAARLLQSETGVSAGAEITVDKRIPAGAGLGGGSSDAATTLVALNALWSTGLSRDDLAALGAGLGADVPVFVAGRAAWAEGIGELLTPVDFPEPWYAVIYPGMSVATSNVFDDPELTRNSAPITISRFIRSGGRNDCTRVVRKRYAEVGRALDWLGRQGNARLTGTGASVFAEFESEDEAREVLRGLPGAWCGFVTRGLNRSPLLDLA